jgi:hypothetical protein
MKRKYIILAALICLVGTGMVCHTATAFDFERVNVPMSVRSVTLAPDDDSSESTLSQFLVPAIASFALQAQTDLVVSLGGATTALDPEDGDTSNLNGPTDATVQLFHHFAQKRALIHAGLSVPTGKTALDSAEYTVAVVMGNPLLGFPLREYGRGFDLSIGAAYAKSLYRGIALGFGGGMIYHGAYALLEESTEYKPGMEISLNAGVDAELAVPRGSQLRLDGTFRIFGTDSYDGDEIFTQGNQFELQGIVKTPGDKIRSDLIGRVVLRQNNTYYTEQGSDWREIETSPGTQLYLRWLGQYRITDTVWAGLVAEMTGFSGSDSQGVNGSTMGVGPTVAAPLGKRAALQLRTLFLSGAIDGDDDYPGIDLSGYQLSLSLAMRPIQ